ncbi:MAG: bifunctional (p)ppGpp synthetase/guanosine-3',5'-bis(diphosphate) 3'-pyrophosphohydrolase [Oscillospiraceae bacterium]|nr:bifunctional (p)ppGpp synthetase/guanosine-3',5'-bis(diphosphate) 3'-pyrophosphohydrolase [Oscillospiraceae bacterium]
MDNSSIQLNIPLDPDALFSELEARIAASGRSFNMERIQAAYEMAKRAHAGQNRKDGSPYVTHCVSAAQIALEMGLDEDSIVATLLHDIIEDTELTHDDISREFGTTVADLVEGVTKLTRVQYTSKEDEQMENMRKMLLAMAKDIRVILIKIADRLHNMRTMAYQSAEKQRLKSLETMEIYAPLAHRLGMQKAKWELEDLALLYLDPDGYHEITNTIEAKMPQLEQFMETTKAKIEAGMRSEHITCTVQHRIKHIYSIYRKMYSQKIDLSGVFDLCAFRVIVDSIPDCYNALGILHNMFKPVPGRFKDYISTPKPNMYQSVHTTVIGSEGIPFEVQIRTWDMHYTAEYGVAAHWKYKIGDTSALKSGDEDKFAWIRRLLETQQESDAGDFIHDLKVDMFADEVFVFSPKGDVINLPSGATPIDFAYSIHSDIGNHMIGAVVNSRIVNLNYVLQNGDIVEIRTSKSAPGPNRDWLNIARSGSARTKIKQWFKRERRDENIMRGRDMIESEFKHNGLSLELLENEAVYTPLLTKLSLQTVDDLYACIGYGGITATRAAHRLRDEAMHLGTSERKNALDKMTEAAERREQQAKHEQHAINGILVEGIDNCLVKFSRCCMPVPGDPIVGFITRGQGVSIHRKDCKNYLNQSAGGNEARWIKVSWANQITNSYVTTFTIAARDRSGLVLDIATVLNSLNAKVRTLSARTTVPGEALIVVTLEVKNSSDLKYIISRIASIPGVTNITRAGG